MTVYEVTTEALELDMKPLIGSWAPTPLNELVVARFGNDHLVAAIELLQETLTYSAGFRDYQDGLVAENREEIMEVIAELAIAIADHLESSDSDADIVAKADEIHDLARCRQSEAKDKRERSAQNWRPLVPIRSPGYPFGLALAGIIASVVPDAPQREVEALAFKFVFDHAAELSVNTEWSNFLTVMKRNRSKANRGRYWSDRYKDFFQKLQ